MNILQLSISLYCCIQSLHSSHFKTKVACICIPKSHVNRIDFLNLMSKLLSLGWEARLMSQSLVWEGCTTSPSKGYMSSPSEGYTSSTSEGYTSSPSEGCTSSPSKGCTSLPSKGSRSSPLEGYTSSPSEGYTSSPSENSRSSAINA